MRKKKKPLFMSFGKVYSYEMWKGLNRSNAHIVLPLSVIDVAFPFMHSVYKILTSVKLPL